MTRTHNPDLPDSFFEPMPEDMGSLDTSRFTAQGEAEGFLTFDELWESAMERCRQHGIRPPDLGEPGPLIP